LQILPKKNRGLQNKYYTNKAKTTSQTSLLVTKHLQNFIALFAVGIAVNINGTEPVAHGLDDFAGLFYSD
jgi:hypothetical protein